MAIKIEIETNNSAAILAELESAIEKGLNKAGDIVVNRAKDIVPVDTGALRDSISKEVEGSKLSVGATEDYAAYVELGTSKMGARPYLRPAIENNISAIKQAISEAMK